MSGGKRVARLTAAMLVLCAPAAMARAASPSAQAASNALVILPVTVVKVKDMDFGDLASTTAGTAVLEPNGDTLTTSGGASPIGGSPHCAEFAGAAQSSSVVNIKVPNQPSTLTRVGGTETMTVSSFTIQGQSKRTLAKSQSFTFRVGGTLNVAANQVQGTYIGTFNVTVQYP
jgi:hypothetical protein